MDAEGSHTQKILCFATQGEGHLDAVRLHYLLEPLDPERYAFDHDRKLASALGLAKAVLKGRPALVVMEGTGVAGGVTLLLLTVLRGVPFVVSSGDAVGPYLRLHSRTLGAIGGLYERLLCRRCAGYIGWTPYLVGRALTFGARRAMTAPGWARNTPSRGAREQIRGRLGIPADALLVGLVGSLDWTENVGYAYGAELVHALRRLRRPDVYACIVGDGSGRRRLEQMAGEELGRRILLPGRVPAEAVADYLAAFDVASLSQSVDRVGSFRYSTKLSEYLAAGLPIITTQIPAAYDLDEGHFWRLPGWAPWSSTYQDALVALLERLSSDSIRQRREALSRRAGDPFEPERQRRRTVEFITEILASEPG
jgi:Glycosyl transferases group 1